VQQICFMARGAELGLQGCLGWIFIGLKVEGEVAGDPHGRAGAGRDLG